MTEDKHCNYALESISQFTLWGGIKRRESITHTSGNNDLQNANPAL